MIYSLPSPKKLPRFWIMSFRTICSNFKIMNAVIMEQTTTWDKETKTTRIHGILYNYTARPRSYTILMNWPEKQGAIMVDNEEVEEEAAGLWAWKIETLQPGEERR